jgi:hypothetical protein
VDGGLDRQMVEASEVRFREFDRFESPCQGNCVLGSIFSFRVSFSSALGMYPSICALVHICDRDCDILWFCTDRMALCRFLKLHFS